MNLMRPSHINPAISAYNQVHGIYDFNKHPLAPPGCKILIHDRPDHRASWDDKGTEGFYIGPALEHYRNYRCYINGTNSIRTSDTVEFYPKDNPMPASSSSDRLHMILTDLLDVLRHPHPSSPFLRVGTELNDAIRAVQQLVKSSTPTAEQRDPAPTAAQHDPVPIVEQRDPTPPSTVLEPTVVYPIGTIIKKRFGSEYHEGEIIAYDTKNQYYKVRYRDDDTEELDSDEIARYRKPRQYYSRALISDIGCSPNRLH